MLFTDVTTVDLASEDRLHSVLEGCLLKLDMGRNIAMLSEGKSGHVEHICSGDMILGQPETVEETERGMVVQRNIVHLLAALLDERGSALDIHTRNIRVVIILPFE
jgi:hypothetical protein